MKRAENPAYPAELRTLGDHLRKVRLDRGLSQPDVAKILNVTPDTVTGWELNRHIPPPRSATAIIAFLGYFPFTVEGESLAKQLYYARLISGKTQEEVANIVGCDESIVRLVERNARHPKGPMLTKIQAFIGTALESMPAGSDIQEV